MSKATLFAPSLVALLLSCSALSGTAQAGWFSSDAKPAAPAAKTDDKAQPQPGTTLDDSIRQAQMLRLAGSYSEAINHLSQLMLVAADDSRVISEYGKTLAAMGRADEAEKFLTRAQELQPNDWTVYSALGVANDQIGNQTEARINYERALALKPGEPSVLSNYALSRMLAKDTAMASRLADRAEIANAAAHDDKIARNIAMIRSMAPPAADTFAVNTPAPQAPAAAPHVTVAQAALAPVQHVQPVQHAQPVVPAPQAAPVPMASSAPPRQLVANTVIQAQPQAAQFANHAPQGVVMQAVPIDPLAGPIQLHPPAPPRAQRSVPPKAQAAAVPAPMKNEVPKALAKAEAPKPEVKTADAKPMSAADSLEARAEAIAKTLNKPGAIAQAKAEANKPEVNKDVPAKPVALAKATPVKPATQQAAAKVSVPVKAADVKPNAAQAAPKVLPPAGVKAADAKPAAGKTAAAKPKDAIPGLRMSANAY
jgi:Flp pilus assembly protein TadD